MSSRPDPDLADEVVRLLLGMTTRLGQHFAARASEAGLSTAEGKVLVALEPGASVPMRLLAERLSFDASNLTPVIDRLAARGAVRRRPHPSDRRVKTVELTAAGEELRTNLSELLRTDVTPLRGLTEQELRELHGLLSRALADES